MESIHSLSNRRTLADLEDIMSKVRAKRPLTVTGKNCLAFCAHHEHYSLLTSTDHICVCGSRLKSHCIIFVCVKDSAMSSPCWSLPHLLSSSPPQHEAPPGRHDLLQDDTETPSTSSRTFTVDKQR